MKDCSWFSEPKDGTKTLQNPRCLSRNLFLQTKMDNVIVIVKYCKCKCPIRPHFDEKRKSGHSFQSAHVGTVPTIRYA